MFQLSSVDINTVDLRRLLLNDTRHGAFVTFEGWVRQMNDNKRVASLDYSCYEQLASNHGNQIMQDCLDKYDIIQAACVHRVGHLQLGDLAVWVGVVAEHRLAAFEATQYIIDRVKFEIPIWKQEFYREREPSQWLEK